MADRDDQSVVRFIERFASVLVEGGIPRMPARVFAALIAEDSGRLTAAELADRLRASPAAISGAVRYLAQVHLVTREREPGSRRDVFHVRDDVWYEASMRQDQMLTRWEERLREGVETLGGETPAGQRLTESVAYLEFIQKELPELMERWRSRRDALRRNRMTS